MLALCYIYLHMCIYKYRAYKKKKYSAVFTYKYVCMYACMYVSMQGNGLRQAGRYRVGIRAVPCD